MTHDEQYQYHSENLHLTPSQRLGAVPLPDPIKPEHLSRRFQIALDLKFGEEIDGARGENYRGQILDAYRDDNNIRGLLFRYKTEILEKFPDEITESMPSEDRQFITNLLRNGQYNEILDLCEWFLINAYYLNIKAGIVTVFDSNPSAYKIGYAENNVPFIYPVNQASAEVVANAIAHLNSTNQTTILEYIRQAATSLNNKDYAGSVGLSIKAVEHIALQIAPKSNTLGQALHEIYRLNLLPHPTLKGVFDKMWGYASDVVRHASKGDDVPEVKLDESVLMFGLCAVTADYLASKQQPN